MPPSKDVSGPELSSITCAGCGKSLADRKRLPHGWKRWSESEVFCRTCWKERYVLRAIIFPVASPLDASWEELSEVLRHMWQQTTSCSNWTVTQLALSDKRRMPGDVKMPRMPKTYLYPEARRLFPELPPQTVTALQQAVTRTYLARRYEVIWTGQASLPTYRYPQPFPVHNQSWRPELQGAWPVVVVRIGERQFRLRLKGGPHFRHQLAAFRDMVAGHTRIGELALYEARDKLLCRLVAWLPRRIREAGEGTLVVKTMQDAMLAAVNAKDERIWTYNADHVPRWGAEHRSQLQRWREDTKHEHRQAIPFATRWQAAVEKYHNRMRSAAYQAAAYVAGYAKRRRFATVSYDDSERSWCPGFPWEKLRTRLATILDEGGIRLELVASMADVRKTSPSLAKEVNDKS